MKSLIFIASILLSLSAFSADTVLSMGDFYTVAPNHDTRGTVEIVENDQGERMLILEEDFSTLAGPALYIVLHKELRPRTYTSENSVMLAPLSSPTGMQVYRIPANVDLSQYLSVQIWCKDFDVTFGAAELL